jgi:hypothetical protein
MIKRKSYLYGLLVFLLFSSYLVYKFVTSSDLNSTTNQPIHELETDQPKAAIEALKIEINQILKNTTIKNEEAYEQTISQVNNAEFLITGALQGIPSTLDELTTLKKAFYLAYLGAYDRIKNTTNQENYISEVLDKHILPSCITGTEKTESALSQLEYELEENLTDMQISLMHTLDKFSTSDESNNKSFVKLINDLHSVTESKSIRIARDTSFGIFIPVSVYFIVTNKIITKLLSPIVSGFVKRGLAVLPVAAVDGPLPIGDFIMLSLEVASLAWASYDLFNAQVKLKDELRVSLRSLIEGYANDVVLKGTKEASDLINKYESINSKIVQNIHESI